MMSESIKRFLNISVKAAIIVFTIRCFFGWSSLSEYLSGVKIFDFTYSIIGYASEAIALSSIFMICFNRYLWKWKAFHKLWGHMPVLSERYKGTITYKMNDVEHTKDAEMEIKQTYLDVVVKLRTDESYSSSITVTIETRDNVKQLVYTYINTPKAQIQDRSIMHYGTAVFDIDNPETIHGDYYTMRLTRGSIVMKADIDK